METTLIRWLESDAYRVDALRAASRLGLADWCLAAGFVRNLAWDRLYGHGEPTPLNDVDLIYFDPDDASPGRDESLEAALCTQSSHRWSVKNQARMHLRNGDEPYRSTAHAMTFWPEVETAVGVRSDPVTGRLELIAPFGVAPLFAGTITMNALRPKHAAFTQRIATKRWLHRWPHLTPIAR